jgi:hypothetical protein
MAREVGLEQPAILLFDVEFEVGFHAMSRSSDPDLGLFSRAFTCLARAAVTGGR